jgi:hypothetical protein
VPKAKDTSQRGDWSCARNEQFSQVIVETTGKGKKAKSAKVEKVQDIKLSFDLLHSVPWDENGVFKFDFLTLVRPPANSMVQVRSVIMMITTHGLMQPPHLLPYVPRAV